MYPHQPPTRRPLREPRPLLVSAATLAVVASLLAFAAQGFRPQAPAPDPDPPDKHSLSVTLPAAQGHGWLDPRFLFAPQRGAEDRAEELAWQFTETPRPRRAYGAAVPPHETVASILGNERVLQLFREDLADYNLVEVGPGVVQVEERTMATHTMGVLEEKALSGALIRSLYIELFDRAEEMKDWASRTGGTFSGHVALAVDPSVPYSVLQPVLYSAGQAGFSELSLLVGGAGPLSMDRPLPSFTVGFPVDGPVHPYTTLYMTPQGAVVVRARRARGDPRCTPRVPCTDLHQAGTFATRDYKSPVELVPSDSTTYGEIIAVLDSLGPGHPVAIGRRTEDVMTDATVAWKRALRR